MSPIPKIFGVNQVGVLNTWFPKDILANSSDLNLPARSALSVNYDSGETLFEKNPERELPVASIVKIMTALVALEKADPVTDYIVSDNAAKVGENSMGLTAGEKLTLKELLYGLMLPSGNDAAVTIAEGVAGSEDKFVTLMNQEAQILGLKNTKFINSSGLDIDGEDQYSTAADLAVIARYAWNKYPLFREITSTYHEYLGATDSHKAFDLYNDTNLLTTYPGVKGIKPGFTWNAGLCLVTYAENNGKKVLAVILGSDDRRGEMKELLDYSFNKLGVHVSHPALDM